MRSEFPPVDGHATVVFEGFQEDMGESSRVKGKVLSKRYPDLFIQHADPGEEPALKLTVQDLLSSKKIMPYPLANYFKQLDGSIGTNELLNQLELLVCRILHCHDDEAEYDRMLNVALEFVNFLGMKYGEEKEFVQTVEKLYPNVKTMLHLYENTIKSIAEISIEQGAPPTQPYADCYIEILKLEEMPISK